MRTALAVGRLDFWNIPTGKRTDDLTPYEELVWQVYEYVEPWGERRQDIRIGRLGLHLLQAQSVKRFTDDDCEKIWNGLVFKVQEPEPEVTVEQAAEMGKALFARLRK